MGDAKFAVVSFFDPRDTKSVDVDDSMENAKTILEEKIESGEWNARDLRWFRINLLTHGDLAPPEMERKAVTAIFNLSG